MIVPTKCPICNDPLFNQFGIGRKNRSAWKTCNRRITHNIEFFMMDEDDVEVSHITINLDGTRIVWFTRQQELLIKSDTGEYKLPYFEPDLSDYKKLINKVRTYLVFS